MNERETDLRNKLQDFQKVKTASDPACLFEWATNAKLALAFRDTDVMIGLDTIDETLIDNVETARLEALQLAGEGGYEQACLEYATAVWNVRDADRASTAAKLVTNTSANPNSAYLLGLFSFHGFGLSKDQTRSLTWHRKAADAGNSAAMFELYAMLSQGLGGPTNPEEAMRWCHKSAEGGNPRAMANLGSFYATGNGVVQDEATSLKWYEAAAQHGHGKAAATLGIMYGLGQGAPESAERAKEYFSLADENGYDWRDLADASGLDPDDYDE